MNVQTASGFFSLGLGGWIVVEFDNPITNVEGVDDVILVEDTWGTYVAETAEVYASNDGVTWTLLGVADNGVRDTVYTWQTTSTFDLGDLESARFIKVVDTTPVETMPVDGDGYDLNSIQALNDYEECTEVCTVCDFQRAWAGAKLDPGAAWSRWFRYLVTIAGEVISQEELPAAVWPGNDEIAAPGQSDEAGVGQPSERGAPVPARQPGSLIRPGALSGETGPRDARRGEYSRGPRCSSTAHTQPARPAQ